MDDLDKKDVEDFEKLAKTSKFKEIDVLYLHGGGKLSMDRFEDCIPALFKNTDTQIYIDSFNLDQEDIERIFRHCQKTRSLHIINCTVGDLENLVIPEKESYRMTNLDLYWTAIDEDDKYIDADKFEELLKAIGNSKLSQSLKTIHVCENDFEAEAIEEIIDDLDMKELEKLKIHADEKEPEVLN
jgi:hypothetical protein